MLKRIFLVVLILVLAMVIAIPVAAFAAQVEEYTIDTPQVDPAPVTKVTEPATKPILMVLVSNTEEGQPFARLLKEAVTCYLSEKGYLLDGNSAELSRQALEHGQGETLRAKQFIFIYPHLLNAASGVAAGASFPVTINKKKYGIPVGHAQVNNRLILYVQTRNPQNMITQAFEIEAMGALTANAAGPAFWFKEGRETVIGKAALRLAEELSVKLR